MWPLFVVHSEPVLRDLANLLEIGEQVGVEHFRSIGLIEASMNAFLLGLPGRLMYLMDSSGVGRLQGQMQAISP